VRFAISFGTKQKITYRICAYKSFAHYYRKKKVETNAENSTSTSTQTTKPNINASKSSPSSFAGNQISSKHSGKKLKSFSIKKLSSLQQTSEQSSNIQGNQPHSGIDSEIDPSWDNDVTPEMLQKAWANYAQTIESKNPRLFSMLMAHSPRLKGKHAVVFPLQNETQEVELVREKGPLMRFLRKELKNARLQLEVEYVREESEPTKAFTAADKYKLLVQKNPVLDKLRDALNLDLE
jgi:DNA polymerase-3 subunit gamma/tau